MMTWGGSAWKRSTCPGVSTTDCSLSASSASACRAVLTSTLSAFRTLPTPSRTPHGLHGTSIVVAGPTTLLK